MRSVRQLAAALAATVLVALGGCSAGGLTDLLNALLPSTPYSVSEDVYGPDSRQRYDLYLPASGPARGVVVFVYGGAWRGGRKADFEFVAHALTGLSLAVLIPDYRHYPEVTHPAFAEDVATAIAALEDSAAVDAALKPGLVLMGHSAGAHTASLLALTPEILRRAGVKTPVARFVGLAGPYDLPLDNPEVAPVFADADPDRVKSVRLVGASAPPALLLHGAADARVLPLHSRRLAEAYRGAGVEVELAVYDGVDHASIVGGLAAPLRFLNPAFGDLKRFLEGFGTAPVQAAAAPAERAPGGLGTPAQSPPVASDSRVVTGPSLKR